MKPGVRRWKPSAKSMEDKMMLTCSCCGQRKHCDVLAYPDAPASDAFCDECQNAGCVFVARDRPKCKLKFRTKVFRVPVFWTVSGVYYLEGESKEEVIETAKEKRFFPVNFSFVEGSFEIDADDIEELYEV